MSEIMDLTQSLSVYVQHARRETRAEAHTCVFLNAATRDLDGVDNETASDLVHL